MLTKVFRLLPLLVLACIVIAACSSAESEERPVLVTGAGTPRCGRACGSCSSGARPRPRRSGTCTRRSATGRARTPGSTAAGSDHIRG